MADTLNHAVWLVLWQTDLKKSLENQGPFDLLVHKVTDILALAASGHKSSEHEIQNLEVSDSPG